MGRLDLPDPIRDEDIYTTQAEQRADSAGLYAHPSPTSVFRLIECLCEPDCSEGCPLD